jgi:hypothetical protein
MGEHPEFLAAVEIGKSCRLRRWESAAMQAAFTQGGGNAGMIRMGLTNAGGEDWKDPGEVSQNQTIKIFIDPEDRKL